MTQRNDGIYRVGMATTDVTPPVGTTMVGFANRRTHTSTSIYHPLRAVAVTIDDGDTPMLLLSVEWLGFYDTAPRVRARLSQATGIPERQIVLIGTHTHCGPAIRKQDITTFGWIDDEYVDRAIENMTVAARRAWQYRFDARVKIGHGRCDIAMNRRAPDPARPGRVKGGMEPNPGGPTDHEVIVLAIESAEDGVVRGILFNYACHTTARQGLAIGGDYVSYAYDYLGEAFLNAQPCFLQGCGGDQKVRPVDGDTRFGSRSIDQVRDVGHQLGETVTRVIRDSEMAPIRGPLAVRQVWLDLQTEPLDRDAVADVLENEHSPWYQRRWAQHHHERLSRGLPEQRTVPFELQTITFGRSLAVVTMAAEMTVEHGLRLKRELRPAFEHVLPLAYTNDIVGYVPVERQFAECGYEVLDANQMHRRTGRYTRDTERRIHEQVHAMLGLSNAATLPVDSDEGAATRRKQGAAAACLNIVNRQPARQPQGV